MTSYLEPLTADEIATRAQALATFATTYDREVIAQYMSGDIPTPEDQATVLAAARTLLAEVPESEQED